MKNRLPVGTPVMVQEPFNGVGTIKMYARQENSNLDLAIVQVGEEGSNFVAIREDLVKQRSVLEPVFDSEVSPAYASGVMSEQQRVVIMSMYKAMSGIGPHGDLGQWYENLKAALRNTVEYRSISFTESFNATDDELITISMGAKVPYMTLNFNEDTIEIHEGNSVRLDREYSNWKSYLPTGVRAV